MQKLHDEAHVDLEKDKKEDLAKEQPKQDEAGCDEAKRKEDELKKAQEAAHHVAK